MTLRSLFLILIGSSFSLTMVHAQEQGRRGIPWDVLVQRSDTNRDGRITRDEFRGPPAIFERLDANQDGVLTQDEHARATSARPNANPAPVTSSPDPVRTTPSHADVSYGPHDRNMLDLWLAKSDKPAPLAIFIHGGGFIGGDKEQINARERGELLDAGISVAAINYRLLSHGPLPAAHQDATRAVQFLRSKAGEWNLDKTRFGGFGGSAGAQLVMYLAFHDDLAAPESADPVARESSRLACAAPTAGQITMDMRWWDEHVPGYSKNAQRRRSNSELFGTDDMTAAMTINTDISALSLISRDDPPVFMSYSMAPDSAMPGDGSKNNWLIHHVIHGIELKKRCDELGVEAHLNYPGASTRHESAVAFFKAKLLVGANRASGPDGLAWTEASVQSPDGVAVPLRWVAPPGDGPFPAVVFVHGAPGGIGQEGLDGLSRSSRWTELVGRGFLVCLADYRGHAANQPFAVLNGETNAADDLAAVVHHLAALPQCDAKRLSLIGGSLGGMVTIEAVTTGRLSPSCIVLNAPATFPLLRLRGRPEAGRELADRDFDRQGALARMQKVPCPVLIVQGTADALTPLNKALHTLLKEAGKDARIELFEGEGHGFTNGPESDAYGAALKMTVEFIEQHTRAAGSGSAPRDLPGPWAEPRAEPDGLKYRTFASKAAGTDVSYAIYLPPGYDTAKDTRYPVVYWLHGRGGSQTGAGQLARRLDAAIRAGKASPMIVVGVNGLKTSSFVDWENGLVPVQTIIVKEVIPHVDATYRTIATREGRAIEGFSMGGAGAPKIGFKHPELFGAVSILAGALHDLESTRRAARHFRTSTAARTITSRRTARGSSPGRTLMPFAERRWCASSWVGKTACWNATPPFTSCSKN